MAEQRWPSGAEPEDEGSVSISCGPLAAPRILEADRPLGESMLWRAQRGYFEREGIGAWSDSTVPHYVTNNVAFAHAVAQVVLGFFRDCRAAGSAGAPFHILELGAGSGRFGFLFLRALLELRARSGWSDAPFRYVMTDLAASNLAFWRAHPSLRPFVEAGVLDFALVDAERPGAVELCESRTTLRAGDLAAPLVVLANYVLDSLPQDAFSFAGGVLHDCLATVATTDPDLDLARADTADPARLAVSYRRRPARPEPYAEPAFNEILRGYAGSLDGSTVLFPAAALRCVEQLAALSRHRILLVSADKGAIDVPGLVHRDDPAMVVHGSFSLPVNYHAVGAWFRRRGGEALLPERRQPGLQVAAFLLGAPDGPPHETRYAYHLAFGEASWGDFFRLRRGIQDHYALLAPEHLLALLRLSRHDPRILRDCLPLLAGHARAPEHDPGALSEEGRKAVAEAVLLTWENYYSIGEPQDLAFELAGLLHALDEHAAALRLFETSLRLHGEDPRTCWNMALCLVALGRAEEAVQQMMRARELDPELKPAGLVAKDA